MLAWWNWKTFGFRSRFRPDSASCPLLLNGHPYYSKTYRKFGDENVGGLSEGYIGHEITPEFGVVTEFFGEVNGETSHKMYSLPFISFTTIYPTKVQSRGNAIRLIIRRVPLDTESEFEKEKMLPIQIQLVSATSFGFTDEYTATVCPTFEWRVFELPFSHWSKIRAAGTSIHEGIYDHEEEEFKFVFRSLTWMVRSQKSRPFKFQVAAAEFIYNPDFKTLHKVFPKRPVFFEALPDYSKASVQDYFTYEEFFAYKLKRQKEEQQTPPRV